MTTMKDLFLLTDRFPFKNGETFIESEIEILANRFDRVFILPCGLMVDTTQSVTVPSNVYVCPPAVEGDIFSNNPTKLKKVIWGIKHIIFWYAFALFDPLLYKELRGMKKVNKLSVSCLNKALRTLSPAIRNSYNFKKYLKQYSFDEVYCYSYWLEPSILYAGRMTPSGIIKKRISRVHGWDLYSERNAENYLAFQRQIIERLDAIYCISANGEKYLSDKYPESSKKFQLSRLGTNDCGISCSIADERVFTVASCSHIIPLKRVDRIIEGLSLLAENISSSKRIRWIHFGTGSEEQTIKEYAFDKLNGRVEYHLMGKVPNLQLLEYYKNNHIDVFVNVSTAEGLPVSIMEAMSFGIPCIATNVGGTGEIVLDKINGRLQEKDFTNDELCNAFLYMEQQTTNIQLRTMTRELWQRNYHNITNYNNFIDSIFNL